MLGAMGSELPGRGEGATERSSEVVWRGPPWGNLSHQSLTLFCCPLPSAAHRDARLEIRGREGLR